MAKRRKSIKEASASFLKNDIIKCAHHEKEIFIVKFTKGLTVYAKSNKRMHTITLMRVCDCKLIRRKKVEIQNKEVVI